MRDEFPIKIYVRKVRIEGGLDTLPIMSAFLNLNLLDSTYFVGFITAKLETISAFW